MYFLLLFQLENCLALGGTLSFDEGSVNDGTAIADCLVQLSPVIFTADWRSKIITETAGNWKLRVRTHTHTQIHLIKIIKFQNFPILV